MNKKFNRHAFILIKLCLGLSLYLFGYSSTFAGEKCDHPAAATVTSMVDGILVDLNSQLKKDGKIDGDDVYRLVNRLLIPKADLDTTARLVLVRNWKKLDAAQQNRFITEFSRQMIRTYGVAFQAYDGETVDFDCKVKKLSGNVGRVEFSSVINHNKQPSNNVKFRLLNKAGQWRVYDLIIDGISIVDSYRTVYSEKFKKDKPNKILDDMHITNCKDKTLKSIC